MSQRPSKAVGTDDRRFAPMTDSSEADDRWQWDIVSWLVIALLGLFVLLLVMALSPHGERQLKEHMKLHEQSIEGATR